MEKIKISNHWITKALSWADDHFDHFSYYQHNGISYPNSGFKNLLAIGAKKVIAPAQDYFSNLSEHCGKNWLFGYFGYDLKDEIHGLKSSNPDHLKFPELYFFEPLHLIEIKGNEALLIHGDSQIFDEIEHYQYHSGNTEFGQPKADFSKVEYVNQVHDLIDRIIEGDIYEINFCQGFFGDYTVDNITTLYTELNRLSPKPFSCLQKFSEHYIICASPERFLKKVGSKLISQPIKGTRPRGENEEQDKALKFELRNDEKELAENMMIVDLVRNDLARSSKPGSVKVEEMFGIYSFQHVHQMISTVTSEIKESISPIDAIQNAFPMGSMTGAPKRKVMELTELYERSKRGAFSGASGYFEPNGDFDFNVLIRSLFLNSKSEKYGFHVGSAITFDAKAENEYEECFIKAKALLELLKQ